MTASAQRNVIPSLTSADMATAAEKASAFAGSLAQIAALFTLGTDGPPCADPVGDALAFQRLALQASSIAQFIINRHWHAQRMGRKAAASLPLDVEGFREALCGLIGNDLPEFIDRTAYRAEFPAMWAHNPARAFLRLTDADKAKVWEFIRSPRGDS
jgi:hypothetical protein